MVTVKLFGRVLPMGVHLHTGTPEIRWKWNEKNTDLVFRVKVVDSDIIVECDLDIEYDFQTLTEDYVTEIHKRANDLSRACVNMAAFATGYGLVTMLDRIELPDGTLLPTHRREFIPNDCNNAFSLDPAKAEEFTQMLALVITDPPVFVALEDLIRSVTSTHTAAADCGRVIDRIRRIIAPTLKPPSGWKEMQRVLNVSREYQEWISEQSVGNRHGEYAFVPPETIAEIIRRTWAIFNRFLEYRKRGNQPLTAPDFPELV